jgi:hypothetical protein
LQQSRFASSRGVTSDFRVQVRGQPSGLPSIVLDNQISRAA